MTKQPQPLRDDSLLQKALSMGKKSGSSGNITAADVVLSLAWARGQVTITQCVRAWNLTTSGAAYVRLALSLRKHFQDNNL